jgi:hypothetical protein
MNDLYVLGFIWEFEKLYLFIIEWNWVWFCNLGVL